MVKRNSNENWRRMVSAMHLAMSRSTLVNAPKPKEVQLRWHNMELSFAQARDAGPPPLMVEYLAWYNSLNQDPIKDSAEMSTVIHKWYAGYEPFNHLTGGIVVNRGSEISTVSWPNGKIGKYLNSNLKVDIVEPKADIGSFSDYELKILAFLLSAGTNAARTPQIAAHLDVGNSYMANYGLKLRDKKCVATTNDGSAYQLWSLTEHGKFVANEIERRNKLFVIPPIPTKKATQWIVWSPESKLPPSVRHSCEQEAMAVAESMARRYPGQQFLCCEIHAGFKLTKVKKERVVVETVDKMEQV